jgi:phosphatidylglycerophosphate synthase
MRSATEPSAPRFGDFLATNRGGGLYSEAVSQPAGAAIAVIAARLGWPPTALTMVNLVVGVGVSATVVALARPAAAGSVPAWVPGLVALVAWQAAYAFDCADGQLARVTRQASAAGARLDILCDLAVQIGLVAALSAVGLAQHPGTPPWLPAVFAGTCMVNLLASVLQNGSRSASLVPSRTFPVRLVKLVRDYGAITAGAGLVLTFAPQWTVALLVALTAVNSLFLLASIAFAARAALRPPGYAGVDVQQSPDGDVGVEGGQISGAGQRGQGGGLRPGPG